MLAAANRSVGNIQNFGDPSVMARDASTFHPPGMSAAAGNHGAPPSLPRLATQNIHMADIGGGLRTAPPGQGMGAFNFDQFGFGSTVNPAQLHMSDSMGVPGSAFGGPISPFTPQPAIMEDDTDMDFLPEFNQMNFHSPHQANFPHPGSNIMSPGQMEGSQAQFDAAGSPNQAPPMDVAADLMQAQGPGPQPFPMENSAGHPLQTYTSLPETISPESLHPQTAPPDNIYNTASAMNPLGVHTFFPGVHNPFQSQVPFSPNGTSASSNSLNGSARNSSTSLTPTDSITDVTRQALLLSLSQSPGYGQGSRKFSQPSVSSPLSARDPSKANPLGPSLPSTPDLQRFVAAYIQYFHPHFPFLHIPTLSFDQPAYTTNLRTANGGNGFAQGGIVGGGGCLILAMAAIGALYEFDRDASRELFEAAKKMIQLYLEERRKAESMIPNSARSTADLAAQNTPLWLVQAMLLNVVYGHQCGDKTAGDIASTHCTALVSLAKAAGLTEPLSETDGMGIQEHGTNGQNDIRMGDDFNDQDAWASGLPTQEERLLWRRWVLAEERKRTLFAIFHLSSLLVSAYNHAPALMNSEIHLDLPCEEELWFADNARIWAIKRTSSPAGKGAISFVSALSTLLSASQNQNEQFRALSYNQPFGSGLPRNEMPHTNLRPSTFGCLVLINALHNYIWETRQRHTGRKWTTQETESMHAHIEPALRAWQAAWASNPTHSLERPNPFGMGPLSADSIPLLDLAYVRLFVNLGASKEAFWSRDFESMSEELARGSEIVQHADHSGEPTDTQNTASNSPNGMSQVPNFPMSQNMTSEMPLGQHQERESSKRERHLRRAAFYAADSLSMSDKLNVTFAAFTSRELPIQAALCTFDCAQILAEWVATLQERVGRFLGIMGRDNVDTQHVPAMLLLEQEDQKLLGKIQDILNHAEAKMTYEVQQSGIDPQAAMSLMSNLPSATQDGFGSKILKVVACMIDRSAVWPGKCPENNKMVGETNQQISCRHHVPGAFHPGQPHDEACRGVDCSTMSLL